LILDVANAVEAVARGAQTFQEIAAEIEKVERQGRYYRRAAEILGFIRNIPGQNRAVVTGLGRKLLNGGQDERLRILTEAVLGQRLFQRVIPFLESKGPRGASKQELERFIETVTQPVGPTMIPRRVSTIVSWMSALRLVKEHSSKFVLQPLPQDILLVNYGDLDEPLFPRRYDLSEYQSTARRIKEEVGNVTALINEAARERANNSHKMLTDLVADRIRAAGAIPKCNSLIDLSTQISNRIYLFEIKSTTGDNHRAQIRRAISQLYEYRYIHNIDGAKLVVVIEQPPPAEEGWMVDYLVNDRELLIAWDGDRRSLHYPDSLRPDLSFL